MGFTLQESHYRAAQAMPKGQGEEFIFALCAYAYDGTEPSGSPEWLPTFILAKESIDASSKASERGRAMAAARWGTKEEAQVDAGECTSICTSICTDDAEADAQAYAQASCTASTEKKKNEKENEEKKEKNQKKEKKQEKEQEEKEIEEKKPPKGGKEKKTEPSRFSKPTVPEVAAHIAEKGYHFDAESFVAFYESKGWKVGSSPMKSWKAACTTWEKRWLSDHPQTKVSRIWDSDDNAEGWGNVYVG